MHDFTLHSECARDIFKLAFCVVGEILYSLTGAAKPRSQSVL